MDLLQEYIKSLYAPIQLNLFSSISEMENTKYQVIDDIDNEAVVINDSEDLQENEILITESSNSDSEIIDLSQDILKDIKQVQKRTSSLDVLKFPPKPAGLPHIEIGGKQIVASLKENSSFSNSARETPIPEPTYRIDQSVVKSFIPFQLNFFINQQFVGQKMVVKFARNQVIENMFFRNNSEIADTSYQLPVYYQRILAEPLKLLGITELRYQQKLVIANILESKNLLVQMPTGSGKTLLYTLPALVFQKVVVVITPTIALRRDQISNLQQQGVNAVEANSYNYYELLDNKQSIIIFVTPEKLDQDQKLQSVLKDVAEQDLLQLVAIDECHLVLEWSEFRNSYSKLSGILYKIFQGKTQILALTASLSKPEVDSLTTNLGLLGQFETVSFDTYRRNIEIVFTCANKNDKFPKLQSQLAPFQQISVGSTIKIFRKSNDYKQQTEICNQPVARTIIYARMREETEKIVQALSIVRTQAVCYHAKLQNKQQEESLLAWKAEKNIIVATVAFGMGINIKDVHRIINFDLPKSVNEFVQKIGRCGRDGITSVAYQNYSLNEFRYLISLIEKENIVYQIYQLFWFMLIVLRKVCPWAMIQQYYNGMTNVNNCGSCKKCLHNGHLWNIEVTIQQFQLQIRGQVKRYTFTEMTAILQKHLQHQLEMEFARFQILVDEFSACLLTEFICQNWISINFLEGKLDFQLVKHIDLIWYYY